MNRSYRSPKPDGVPELRVGAHLIPEDGACLMEYVSVLAGTAFGDHPGCTDPTLAELARLVNDASSDAGRPQLAGFAPALAATPFADARRTAAIVGAAVAAACTAAGEPPALRRHLRRARRRHARVTGAGPLAAPARGLDLLHRQGPARRRLEAAVAALRVLPGPQRDAALHAVLDAAIAAATPPSRPAVVVMTETPRG
jgi:hypothetical protein